MNIQEGTSWKALVTVTNSSTKQGTPTEAYLYLQGYVTVGTARFIEWPPQQYRFGAGQTRTFNYAVAVPSGYAGYSGEIAIQVLSPDFTVIATSSLPLTYTGTPQVYTCPICGAAFSSGGDLEYHMVTVHPTGPLPVDCAAIANAFWRDKYDNDPSFFLMPYEYQQMTFTNYMAGYG